MAAAAESAIACSSASSNSFSSPWTRVTLLRRPVLAPLGCTDARATDEGTCAPPVAAGAPDRRAVAGRGAEGLGAAFLPATAVDTAAAGAAAVADAAVSASASVGGAGAFAAALFLTTPATAPVPVAGGGLVIFAVEFLLLRLELGEEAFAAALCVVTAMSRGPAPDPEASDALRPGGSGDVGEEEG